MIKEFNYVGLVASVPESALTSASYVRCTAHLLALGISILFLYYLHLL